jgi:hypothetical protein
MKAVKSSGAGGRVAAGRLGAVLAKDQNPQAEQAAEKVLLVILSEAKNLSVNWTWIEERFFASLRMTPKIGFFRSLWSLPY